MTKLKFVIPLLGLLWSCIAVPSGEALPGQQPICEVNAKNGEMRPGDSDYYVLTHYGRVIGEKLGSSVNVRSGPSTSAEIIGAIYVGNQVRVVGEGYGDECHTWYQVWEPDARKTGFVYSRFIHLTGNENSDFYN